MRKSIAVTFIGGIAILVGVFAPWTSVPGMQGSGWDLYNVTMLAGGILVLVGVLTELVLKSKIFITLIPVGAILALVNVIQVIRASASTSNLMQQLGASLTIEYGIYLCLVGAVLSLIGVFWYGKEISKPRVKRKREKFKGRGPP